LLLPYDAIFFLKGSAMTEELRQDKDWRDLNETWRFRFGFYDQHWGKSPEALKAALETLSPGDQRKINLNWWAFFFGIFYLLALGLWRQAILMLFIGIGLTVVTTLLAFVLPEAITKPIDLFVSIAFCMYVARCVNEWYYLKKAKGGAGWRF
jgi:hypothetical protein